ncbi:MAG TPA: hypothetical protein VND22_09330 [Actinomycetota bacterium]|nr:hypothetical protein [Actinomycetota bacterium]
MMRGPVDPVVRISLFADLVRREKKLVAAILIAALVAIGAVVSSSAESEEPFTQAELQNLSRLPLAPDAAPVEGPTEAEQEAFRELERKLKESQQQPAAEPAP